MPSHLTKKQRKAKDFRESQKKKYYDDKRRGELATKHLWTFAFVGSISIEDLRQCYNIKP